MLLGFTAALLCGAQLVSAQEKPNERYRPKLFAMFGDNLHVLDGLTQHKNGDIYMSVPNYIDKRYAPVIMKRSLPPLRTLAARRRARKKRRESPSTEQRSLSP